MAKAPKPTDAELELLQVLWNDGPSTVRKIHETLQGKSTRYTTTLKILQKMTDKGLVTRDEANRSHVYHAAVPAEKTRKALVSHLLQSAFSKSPGRLVMHALSEKKTSPEELREIRELLDELEREENPS